MPLQHYLPATFIAAFSNANTFPRRDRKLIAGNMQTKRCFTSRASQLAAINNFYTLKDKAQPWYRISPNAIDNVWFGYEENLSAAIEALINGTIDASTWARSLVPFIASLFVRGPDFNRRFEARLAGFPKDKMSIDNTNLARIMELQSLLAPILAAKWIVYTATGNNCLITNDVGFAVHLNMRTHELGFAIPLDMWHVLVIVPTRSRLILAVKNGKWVPLIDYGVIPTDTYELNATLAAGAYKLVFGPDEKTIRPYLNVKHNPGITPDPYVLGFIGGRLSAVHEFTWHRLVGMLEKPTDSPESYAFPFDPEEIVSDWCPPIMLPTNLPEFPSALNRQGDYIGVDFFDVEGFTTLTAATNGQ